MLIRDKRQEMGDVDMFPTSTTSTFGHRQNQVVPRGQRWSNCWTTTSACMNSASASGLSINKLQPSHPNFPGCCAFFFAISEAKYTASCFPNRKIGARVCSQNIPIDNESNEAQVMKAGSISWSCDARTAAAPAITMACVPLVVKIQPV